MDANPSTPSEQLSEEDPIDSSTHVTAGGKPAPQTQTLSDVPTNHQPAESLLAPESAPEHHKQYADPSQLGPTSETTEEVLASQTSTAVDGTEEHAD
jgi:hypothetical protein